ncbi:MAG TPA: hypothetical protein VG756_31440 [Pseudonocardiaceae bacterium]|nr:hypothetical protein [Pseudonocardiaceae bacterium]
MRPPSRGQFRLAHFRVGLAVVFLALVVVSVVFAPNAFGGNQLLATLLEIATVALFGVRSVHRLVELRQDRRDAGE